MIGYLEDWKEDAELMVKDFTAGDYERDQLKRIAAHIDAVKNAVIIDPIFEAMEAWDVPSAIMFVVEAAIDDPENLKGDGGDIPMHWDT